MSTVGITEVVKAIDNIVNDLIETDKEKLECNLKMQQMYLKEESEVGSVSKVQEKATVDTNHRSIFVAGWRPAIGCIIAVGLGYSYIIHPLFLWINSIFNLTENPPKILDNEMLMTLIFGMIGLGAMRSFEKYKGVSR